MKIEFPNLDELSDEKVHGMILEAGRICATQGMVNPCSQCQRN